MFWVLFLVGFGVCMVWVRFLAGLGPVSSDVGCFWLGF